MNRQSFESSVRTSPLLSSVAIALFAVALFSVAGAFFYHDKTLYFIVSVITRIAVTAGALIICAVLGYSPLKKPVLRKNALLLTVAFAVTAVNLPVSGLITGKVVLTENAEILRYSVYCALIGISEEAVFRGAVQSVIAESMRDKKRPLFKTLFISSAVFSLCHLSNIFSQGVGATLLQVGYTFLTGALFGAVFAWTENLLFPAFFHTVFDLGGLAFSAPLGIAVGNMWDTLTVVLTAAVGVIATAVVLIKVFRKDGAANTENTDNR